MANRKTRKARHYAQNALTFKQKVHIGMARGQLVRGEMNYNEVPQWIRDVWGLPTDEQLVEQVESTVVEEHVHGEHCVHE